MGIGDWGLGIGDWGLGIGDWGLGPIPSEPIIVLNDIMFIKNLFLIIWKLWKYKINSDRMLK